MVGLLERLIEEGCTEAVETGLEKLTEDLLDTVLINLGNDPTRNSQAGEVPAIPAVTPRRTPTRPGSRSRNTVFDDRGIPAAAPEPGTG